MTPHRFRPARLAGCRSSRHRATTGSWISCGPVGAGLRGDRGALPRGAAALLRGDLGSERAEDALQQTFLNAFNSMRGDEQRLETEALALPDRPQRVPQRAARPCAAVRTSSTSCGRRGAAPTRHWSSATRASRPCSRRSRPCPRASATPSCCASSRAESYDEIADALGVGGGSAGAAQQGPQLVRSGATALTPWACLFGCRRRGRRATAARVADWAGRRGRGGDQGLRDRPRDRRRRRRGCGGAGRAAGGAGCGAGAGGGVSRRRRSQRIERQP